MQVLSDRGRAVGLATLLVAAVLLCVWWIRAIDEGTIGNRRVLEQAPGTPVVLSLQRVLAIHPPDRYVVGNSTLRIPVDGPTEGLEVGEDVTVGGVVAPGVIVERWREEAPARPAKRALGIVGLLVGGAVVAAGVRGRPGRFWVPGG